MIHLLSFRHRSSPALPPPRISASLLTLLVCAACAPSRSGIPAPSPAEIPALESSLSRGSADASTMTRLGAAYRADGRFDEARAQLESALEANPGHAGAVLFLGLTYEDLGELERARQLYESYLQLGGDSPVHGRIRGRLPLLRRLELASAIRQAIARETELANGTPQPRTVAVFPFLYAGQDSSLEPLSRAMADMLTTDLSQTERLSVLERTRVQLLIDELELGATGLVDPVSAARGGRLLGAERLVQGAIGGGPAQIQFDAAIVQPWTGVLTSGPGGATPDASGIVRLSESDALQRLFDAEKRLALRIYEAMGVVLTPAERERVNRRPTENLQAILAYGRGLRAADAGDFALAAQHFAAAAALDPSFALARERAAELESMALARDLTTADIAFLGAFEARLPLAFEPLDVLVPSLTGRDPAQEVMGTEGYGTPTVVEVVIERPTEGGN